MFSRRWPGLVSSVQISSDAGSRDARFFRRYESVSPESITSSTTSTWRPAIGMSRSFRIRTTPDECVEDPYDDTAMKSSSHGTVRCRSRSAMKKTAPFSTPITSISRPS